MASHQDLLDAIARVRAATGNRDAWQSGLSGEDIAVACSAWSSPAALGAVLTKIVAAQPAAFLGDVAPAEPPPRMNEGLAADAIRGAETALAQQNSKAAKVDLQVVTAVLNAHGANDDGVAELERLQREIEAAVLSRSDLDTPAGAREFQRFLIGKLRDIRTVIDTAALDATSKASLAEALSALYASATPPPADPAKPESAQSPPPQPVSASPPSEAAGEARRGSAVVPLEPDADSADWRSELMPIDIADLPGEPVRVPEPALTAAPAPAPMLPPALQAPAMATPAMAPAAPAWGGGLPNAIPFGGGGSSSPALPDLGRLDPLADRTLERTLDRADEPRPQGDPDTPEGQVEEPTDEALPEAPETVHLPDGETVSAPSPEVAAAMTAAIAGVPIAEAFRYQGITVPAPGTPVTAPVQAAQLAPGDIGMLTDRHALAVGNDKALLDGQIQPIANVSGPGFLGWQHPPAPVPTTTEQPPTPEAPAPNGPAETAPS